MPPAACPRCGRPLDDLRGGSGPPADLGGPHLRCPRCGLHLPAGDPAEGAGSGQVGGRDDERPVRVALLGFGLIGGSIARALRVARTGSRVPARTGFQVVAWSPSGAGPSAALAEGVLDAAAASPVAAIEGADLIVLAAPPLRCLDLVDGLAGAWRGSLGADATVTDVASTKSAIDRRAEMAGLRFVGGHPMAGRETSGYQASRADLFVGRPWVVVPGPGATGRDVQRVGWLASAVGARPLRMTAAEHDEVVAAISHLPLLASAALVEAATRWAQGSADPDAAARLASTGWRDATRLALGDPAMGAGILATNGPAVARLLAGLQAALAEWAEELARPGGPDPARLEARLVAARELLAAMRAADR
jgi:prephenate dehydrogenase